MGVLRLLLALLVVYVHCRSPFGPLGVSAENAVQIFFMISGFYMTLVLREKYALPGGLGVRAFYVNRGLRLLPAYFLVAAATLFLCLFSKPLLGWEMPPAAALRAWHEAGWLEWPALLWLGVTQLSMAGLETFNFFSLPAIDAAAPGASAGPQPWELLLVPQAWSLSLELYFYLLAPVLVTRRPGIVLGLLLASFALRLALWQFAGLYGGPWSYRFFPAELMFFLLGALAYHAYAGWTDTGSPQPGQAAAWQRFWLRGLLAALAAAAVLISRSGQPFSPGHVIAPLVTALAFLALPMLFLKTRKMRTDHLLGELSYPVYIVHFLIIWMVGQESYPAGAGQFVLVAALTLLAAYGLYRYVDLPIDRWRHAASRPAVPAPATPAAAEQHRDQWMNAQAGPRGLRLPRFSRAKP